MLRRLLLCAFQFLASAAFAAPLVVETDALPPEEQRAKFHLPAGFTIQLVVSDPDIGQPMNLNFDAAGRLWVTSSVEYPYPVEGDGVQPRDGNFQGMGKPPARDRLTVVEGIGLDGKPAKVTTFAGGLNIPIGQVPLSTSKAAVFSIPDIYLCEDTDGDGQSDRQTVLYGRFGNLDTHGMASSFTWWIDGWVYACHGFRNTSTVKGRDGHEFTMNSGNTFRFSPDGNRIEQWTWGQVNPFGMAFDHRGNLYNADCHSKPITMLLRGAYYESFGKPHDGLGFGPNMIDHNHGSTGICGVAFYQADHFPADYQENVFICNPVNGQVHRDKLIWTGATPRIDTQPEFLTCDDGWFRPVDVKLGPDGALYIADFHNAVIGHYEVPLAHPRRDRTTGRIWRVVYTGEGATPPKSVDLTKQTADELLDTLGDRNLTTRVLATHELLARSVAGTSPAARPAAGFFQGEGSEFRRAHMTWLMQHLGTLTPSRVEWKDCDPSPLVRVHYVKALGSPNHWDDLRRESIVRFAEDPDPFVRMAVAEAIGLHPHESTVATLADLLAKTPAEDTHLVHAIRMALRNHLDQDAIVRTDAVRAITQAHPQAIFDILLATTTPASAELLVDLVKTQWDLPRRTEALQRIARFGNEAGVRALIADLQQKPLDLPSLQSAFTALQTGLEQRGKGSLAWLKPWALEVARKLLGQPVEDRPAWTAESIDGSPLPDNPFVTQIRPSADGRADGAFFCTLPRGEQRTGLLRSSSFPCPKTFSFWMAGHNGLPSTPEDPQNILLLRDGASGAILRQQPPPRNDLAQQTTWDLSEIAGQPVYLEILDRDTRGAYAWLAVGRFSLEGLNPRDAVSPIELATRLASALRLEELQSPLLALAVNREATLAHRARAAEAVLSLAPAPDTRLATLMALARDPAMAAALREQCFACLQSQTDAGTAELLGAILKTAPFAQQRAAAEQLASDRRGAEVLLSLVEQGRLAPTLLRHPPLVEKLKRVGLDGIEGRLASLTRDLPPENEAIAKLIAERRQQHGAAARDAQVGKAVFAKHCAACHQIGDVGNRVGPQLDGVGIRGLDRLLEDVLDPNRNVDAAFRASTLVLTDGRVLTGLKRREEGDLLVFADGKGQEFKVARGDIEEQAASPLSLMPANVAELVSPEEFQNLLAFLLTQRTGEGR